MIKIRKLNIKDKDKLYSLIKLIEDNLFNNAFWLPIQEKAKANFFNEDWTVFLGAFNEDKLIGASALFLNKHEYEETVESLNMLKSFTFAEIGRCMVAPDYRGQNIMYTLNFELIKIAKRLQIDYLVATAHPQNLPSKTSLEKLGMKKVNTIIKYNSFPRDVYLYKI